MPNHAHSPVIEKATRLLLRQSFPDGYWWYTLEANETIGSGFIQLMHFLGDVDPTLQKGLVRRLLSQQNQDGSWSLFYEGPSDLSTTVECYFALRLAGHKTEEEPLKRARDFILKQGGLTKIRIFSRIHLALFGLVPWSVCPSMPVWLMLLSSTGPVSIYSFSSWARASIVPLLLVDTAKPVRALPFNLDELYIDQPEGRLFRFPEVPFFSLKNFFIQFDKVLKILERLPWHPGKKKAVQKAEQWVREHIAKTEDIYPAMAYAAIGLKALGYPNSDSTIQKAFQGLKRFQQSYSDVVLPARPNIHDSSSSLGEASEGGGAPSEVIHQQCCISPNWDTPWVGTALLEAGVSPEHPQILKSAEYLLSKEVRFRGDWAVKNKAGNPGAWSFEFQNDDFPDVDDTIQILTFLKKCGLPSREKEESITRGLNWLLSMQSSNGGWAAFDKDNNLDWVNQIPFSDHGACLDPPTPDITGRMLELLSTFGFTKEHPVCRKALDFLKATQEASGAWRGRWGVNYIYGTWCVLQGLAAMKETLGNRFDTAVSWLESVQNKDGGWGESCLSDTENRYVPLSSSTASQTAWAVLGLMAAGKKGESIDRGITWLCQHQNADGGWDEKYYTGTGFPGHFYLRYHGYRYYFPLLALGKYAASLKSAS